MLRDHTCGELRKDHVGQTVTLCGWVDNYRDHGGLVFIDLRDRYGKTQVVFNPDEGSEMHDLARTLRGEYVIEVEGEVKPRPDDMVNPKLATGEIDVRARRLVIHNTSLTPPFQPNAQELPNEDLRLQFRYIDMRREKLQQAMEVRHRITKTTRDYFDTQGFLEIETPILGKSTPEGARDYLVPSRVHPGSFYALPQSPQIYKQLLMVAGCDRYFQIAKCFRDEDLRADRQPEFTQIDLEMSFVSQDDVLSTIDGLVAAVTHAVRGTDIETPLPRHSYADVMERFGTDKPDMRFDMELVDIGDIAKECDFGVFSNTIANGGRVRGLLAPQAAEKYSRKMIDELTAFVGEYGARGLAFFRVKEGKLDSPIAKFFSDEHQAAIIEKLGATDGDLLFFVADQAAVTSAALAALRNRLGKELALYDPQELYCLWVVDFPMFSWNADENRWDAEHHPFCMPHHDDIGLFETDPGQMRAQSYDLVVNGYEAASGSVRIHDSSIQARVFDLLNISREQAQERFGFLLDALQYGAPPHAGAALGLDRWAMLLTGTENIREVIAFPKTQRASDRMSAAPSTVDGHQLRELHLKTDLPAD